jgi:hypothetical protein
VVQGAEITAAIQGLVNKITSSFSLSQSHMNAIHPVLIANKHGYKDVPAQDKHRDFSRGQCVCHTCYTLMLALKNSFELDIQPSSNMDSDRGYMRAKSERGQGIYTFPWAVAKRRTGRTDSIACVHEPHNEV